MNITIDASIDEQGAPFLNVSYPDGTPCSPFELVSGICGQKYKSISAMQGTASSYFATAPSFKFLRTRYVRSFIRRIFLYWHSSTIEKFWKYDSEGK